MSEFSGNSAGGSNNLAIATLLAAVAGMASAIGMTFPLVTLSLERAGVEASVIGLNSATGSLGILCVGLFSGRLLAMHGAFRVLIVACVVSICSLFLMPWVEQIFGWFVLRFFAALGLGFLWLISEAWLNNLADDDKRGQVMGLYGMAFTGGFALGPLLVSLIGSDGWQPFAVTASIMAASSLPLLLLARFRGPFEQENTGNHLSILILGGGVFIFSFASGLFETTTYALMPVYTLAEGLNEDWTLYALSALSAGGIVLQFPMGKLADVWGRYALMVVVALGILVTVATIPFVVDQLALLLGVLFFFGGSIFGLYTLGLILMGDKFGTENLVTANAVFIIMYEAGGVAGPVLSGAAIDLWPEHGFIGFFLACAVLFALLTVFRRGR